MTEDQTPDDRVDEPVEEDAPEPAPEEAPPAEPEAPAEEAPPAEPDAPAEEALAPEEAPEAPAEETPAAEPEAPTAPPTAEREKRKDEAPGANLEPILLEDDRQLSAEERAALEAELEERAQAEAAAVAEVADDVPLREGAKLDLPADARIQATGKRKTSVARVVITPGPGAFAVNNRELAEYFPRSFHQTIARQALAASGYDGQVDVSVRVHGGGISGQADAVRHGIARALVEIDLELRGDLKRRGWLTRDARAKERRKAGLKKARKRPQFSKR